jgi:predicted nuclease of predicted toxin-antitoxin system
MLRFIVDTQLPPRLAEYFNENGFDALHTTDFSEGHLLQDSQIIAIAAIQNRIVVTKDSDFLDHYLLKGTPPKILLIQLGSISNYDLLAHIHLYLNDIHTEFDKDADLIAVNKTNIITYQQR